MRPQNALFANLIVGMGILLLACTGSSDIIAPNPPVSGPGTGPILNLTAEQRLQVLKEAATFVNTLGDLKSETAQQALVAWLQTRPEFEEAEILEGNVWTYFHDGRVAMFIPDWRGIEDNDGGRIGQPAEAPRKKKSPAAGRTSGHPGSNQVKMFFGLGRAFRDYRPFLKNIFSSSDTEYTVTLEEASIENLKNTNDLGVLYIDTHGGLGLKKPRSENQSLFGLWTTDTTSISNESLYEADLNSNYLVYMLGAQNDRNVDEWHYGITDQFVRNHDYMNLAENAVVYIDACNGMTSHASAFKESIMGKAKGGKATYIGWTNLSDGVAGEATAGFIFDRMLGTNIDLNASSGTISAEDPKQRPFDFAKIFDDLGHFTAGGYPLGVSRYGGKLAYQSVNATEIILTPSIEYITMNDYESKMTLKGLFGDKEGATVTVCGVAVPVSWSPNKIVCELPVTGPGSSGDVIVTINGNKSNVVPLSEWTIPVHLIRDDFGVKIEAHLNLKIRADVHKFRSKPGEPPKTERPDAITLPPGSLGFPCSIGSSGTFTVGGQRLATCVKDKCTMRDTETAVNRQGVVPFSITQPGLGFAAYYKWSKDLKKIDVNVIVNIPDSGMEMELYTSCEGSAPVTSGHSTATTLGIFTSKAPGLPVLEFQLDENYDIKSGETHGMQNLPWGRCEAQGYFKHSATWPTVAPSVRPTNDTEARFATGE